MTTLETTWTEARVERMLGRLLRTGVLIAALVVLIGAVAYLAKYGSAAPHYRVFQGEPADLRSVSGVVHDVLVLSSRGIIQLGLLLLIATPVARVALSMLAFLLQRDYLYVTVGFIVLALLLYSLTGGAV